MACNIEDEKLYEQYLDGSEEAAGELVESYADSLTLYIYGFIQDIQDAEDLMIEAFALIFAKARPIHGENSFKGYLYKIGRNLAFRYTKKRRLRLLSMEDIPFEIKGEALAETPLYYKERKRQLYEAMSNIKAEYREALYLIYFEEMSYRQAATIMGKSEGQVTKLVYRGKQSLKKNLEKQGFIYEN